MALAELVGMNISQIRRYESAQSPPTPDAIRKLAGLSVSADMLLFDEDLKLQFEAVRRLEPEGKKVIRSVMESITLRHTMKESRAPRLARAPAGDTGGSTR
jgi:transcriptional regulator with XRE-family HTH domain